MNALRISDPFQLRVDYDLSQEEAVRRGHFDLVDNRIPRLEFLNGQHGVVTLMVREICVMKKTHFAKINAVVEKLRARFARPQELLALAERSPNKQRKYVFVAAGQVWLSVKTNAENFLCLEGTREYTRRLGLEHTEQNIFHPRTKFLVVCES